VALIGRAHECAEIDRLVERSREGLSGVLVLRGEAGIGKTSLLHWAADTAANARVVHVVGIESETHFGYAGLHQLLRPVIGGMADLPAPQRGALECAFGLAPGVEPSPLMIGLATLTLLSAAAASCPLLCLLDDAQWLDQESSSTLAFVARRLYAEGVALIFAFREPPARPAAFDGFSECILSGLPDVAARELLGATAGELPGHVTERIVAEAAGNPLALVELSTHLESDRHSGQNLLPEPLPLSHRLEARFLQRVRALPDDAQLLLLLAAAEPSSTSAQLERVGETLGLDVDACAKQVEDLLSVHETLAFRHPLIRSAVYHGSSDLDRRRVHAALAASPDARRGADRIAWHRAASVAEPDEKIASALERASDRAQLRGGYAAAGAFLTRAAQLTPDSARRTERLLAAASVECTAGAPARAQQLLDEARPRLRDALERARALRLEGDIRYALGETRETPAIMLDAARALYPFDARLARETALHALTAARAAGRFAEGGTWAVSQAVKTMPVPDPSSATAGDLLLDALATLDNEGLAAAAPLLRTALAKLDATEHAPSDEMTWLIFGGWAAGVLGDLETVRVLGRRSVDLARDNGALVVLTRALHNLAISELVSGAISDAEVHFAAGRNLVAPQSTLIDLGELLVLAWRGDEIVRAEAELHLRVATERAHGWVIGYIEYGLATLELSASRYREALYHVNAALADSSYLLSAVLLPDAVEAAIRSNDRETAVMALAGCAERAQVCETALACGLYERSRALVETEDPERDYRASVDTLRSVRGLAHIARSHLVYGEWLRRQGRRLDARNELRTALDMFESIEARGFAKRARSELAATGENVRKRSVETVNELTPQEGEVARLAASGATNAEIAAMMFISANTVDFHLRKVFRKLGITSRRDLRSRSDA
jgi:DNA-binding CsgD family transcriptional regulator